MKKKISYYETLLEDLASENTRLILENQFLKKAESHSAEGRDSLKGLLDHFKAANKKLMCENEDIRYRYEVAEKLRIDMKEQLARYITKNLELNERRDTMASSIPWPAHLLEDNPLDENH